MGGACCARKHSEEVQSHLSSMADGLSDWDDIESDEDLSPRSDAVDQHQDTDASRSSRDNTDLQDKGTLEKTKGTMEETHDREKGLNVKVIQDVVEDPLRTVYSEKEFLSRKRRVFALEMDLYNELTIPLAGKQVVQQNTEDSKATS